MPTRQESRQDRAEEAWHEGYVRLLHAEWYPILPGRPTGFILQVVGQERRSDGPDPLHPPVTQASKSSATAHQRYLTRSPEMAGPGCSGENLLVPVRCWAHAQLGMRSIPPEVGVDLAGSDLALRLGSFSLFFEGSHRKNRSADSLFVCQAQRIFSGGGEARCSVNAELRPSPPGFTDLNRPLTDSRPVGRNGWRACTTTSRCMQSDAFE